MAKRNDNSAPAREPKKLYSINVAHKFTDGAGNDKTKFREVAIGFGNSHGGLGFQLPQGMLLDSSAQIVIFEIKPDQAD